MSAGPIEQTALEAPLLKIDNLQMFFPIVKGPFSRKVGEIKAVNNVSFEIYQRETLSLVGESGSGKTTTGRCLLRVITPTGGSVRYRWSDGTEIDLVHANEEELRSVRREVRMIFQNPQSSLNPRRSVFEIIAEPLKLAKIARGKELEDRVTDLMRRVGLRSEYIRRYPHAFSGGERQRIGIARALALNPRVIIADEAVSALDVSVRAQTLNLLQDLQQEFGFSCLFIAHDLAVVRQISDRVAVMYCGQIVELSESDALFEKPNHPYTEALLSAVPISNPRFRRSDKRPVLPGEVADPTNPPSGCAFHPRCQYVAEICRRERPKLREILPRRVAACHFAERLDLVGVNVKKVGMSSWSTQPQ